MKYYHGTNYSAAMSIIQNGFKESDTIWNCSYPDYTYLYPVNYDNFDETTDDPLESPAFQNAIESGQIAAATVNDLCPVVVVFELDIPDDAEIYEDTSCENSTDTYEMENCELNAGIKNGSIKGRSGQRLQSKLPTILSGKSVYKQSLLQSAKRWIAETGM